MRNPQVNEFYTHKNGETIKVLSVRFNRVTFIRDGFNSPVIMSLSQFSKEYTYVGRA
ncbi:DUF4222 domain-containing protein [Proteus mirabilis]|uniref:DUF4222 domain-containing protein n=1 Tax=Proteus TaxID=583 RepID=UPI000C1F130B|nr:MULTISPECIES: DUF4222 domain-containing protein [Proteus]ELB1101391.1 DUF4222 domain-containing protein [Proteus mirabilis]EMC9358171.1 DUF4222 domain-containing protein [Proteus mirabilis]EMD6179894.1 DUF4222 domain-containing protein [Proteus mirabilis]MCX2588420.1 DUF4222 domain-containing protein [Proteus penneri]MDM3764104.1 DUF4222 domain-containing protein [Proteus mirabilis]